MKSLQEVLDNLSWLFGPRIAMFMRGDTATALLRDSFYHLFGLLRNEVGDKARLVEALADMFAKACCVAESFRDLQVVRTMSLKYLLSGCAYCGKMPCGCGRLRTPDQRLKRALPDDKQMAWNITEWCKHLETVYGVKNGAQGIFFALMRLGEELHGIEHILLNDSRQPDTSLTELRRRLTEEFADVLAWIFSIASLLELELNLGEFVDIRYGDACSRCKKRPCQCGRFFLHSVTECPSFPSG